MNVVNHWLVKTEPDCYNWEEFIKDKRTMWDGVRNYQARNNMQAMEVGDQVLFYHTGDERQVVGTAKVLKTAYPDPTSDDPAWVVVDLAPLKPLKKPVSLAQVKAQRGLKDIALVKNGRLSVLPLTDDEFELIVSMGK